MTRDEAKKLLPVIQAFADGKDVQFRYGASDWVFIPDPNWSSCCEYRIKPESLECWVAKDRNGDLRARNSEQEIGELIRNGLCAPCTIHHMREVIE